MSASTKFAAWLSPLLRRADPLYQENFKDWAAWNLGSHIMGAKCTPAMIWTDTEPKP